MEAMIAILAGGALFLFMAYAIRARALRPTESRLRFLTPQDTVSLERSGDGELLLKRASSRIPALGRLLDRNGLAERWRYELERADMKLRPGEYFLTRLAVGLIAVAVITAFGRSALAFFLALPVGAICYMLPAFWVRFRTQRRIGEIEKQLVETITLIANAMRAGFAFAQGVDVAAKRIGPPMSAELNRMLLDVNLGKSVEESLLALNDRIGSDDVDMVVTAILIQRQTGGNLAEVLETVSETMRDRERITGEIKTMTSQQRLTGWILSIWPTLLGLGFFAINPETTSLLWTTGPGAVLLAIWVILNVIGVYTIRRILDIDI